MGGKDGMLEVGDVVGGLVDVVVGRGVLLMLLLVVVVVARLLLLLRVVQLKLLLLEDVAGTDDLMKDDGHI